MCSMILVYSEVYSNRVSVSGFISNLAWLCKFLYASTIEKQHVSSWTAEPQTCMSSSTGFDDAQAKRVLAVASSVKPREVLRPTECLSCADLLPQGISGCCIFYKQLLSGTAGQRGNCATDCRLHLLLVCMQRIPGTLLLNGSSATSTL